MPILTQNRKFTIQLDAKVKLAEGGKLLPEKHDQASSGNCAGFRECHIGSDWFLIYCNLNLVVQQKR